MSSTRPFSSRAPRLIVGLVLGALVLGSCSSKQTLSGDVVKDGIGCTPDRIAPTTDAPVAQAVTAPVVKIKTTDVKLGKGCVAQAGSYLGVNLLGATAADGKIFRSSWADGRPVNLQLGKSQLIEGLEVGLAGMKVGGRREIRIPAKQAYGKTGEASLGIGPNKDLVFVADLLGVTDTPLYCNQGGTLPTATTPGKPTTVKMPVEAPTKLKTTDLRPGTGTLVAKKGSYVTANYVGVACSTGQQFDSSWDNGQPFSVTVGQGTIQGFGDGLIGVKAGMQRQIEIPAAQAYGAAGSAPKIGPNDPLVFIVDIVDVAAKAPSASTTTAPKATTTTAPKATTTTAATTTTGG